MWDVISQLPRAIALMHPSNQSRPSNICACLKKYAPRVEETRNPGEKRLNTEMLTSRIKKTPRV